MYKKFSAELLLSVTILFLGWFCLKEVQVNCLVSTPAFRIQFLNDTEDIHINYYFKIVSNLASGQRVVDYNTLEKKVPGNLSESDYTSLLRIVEAEAGCEDEEGKMLVAGVIMNRVNSTRFPDTVEEVVLQSEGGVHQFSPVSDGRYYTVKVSNETETAVNRVLNGEDISEGALYFAARKYADPEKMKWFDKNLTLLYQHGGHEFFR